MTKEQFIKFKQDMKTAIEYVKIDKKASRIEAKMYYNAGFDSEESQKEAVKALREQLPDLKEKIYHWMEKSRWGEYEWHINPSMYYAHWAYYCAKHQLNEDERKQYYIKQVELMTGYACLYDFEVKHAENIIAAYEKI